ncbi:MAG: hypothetical protein R3E35_02415 [Rhodocyclaceae bacterium]
MNANRDRKDAAVIALSDCAGHYIGWLKACFGEIALFCDGHGAGGSVGWSPRDQCGPFMTLWGYRQVGEVAGCTVFTAPAALEDAVNADLLLDVAFGAAEPFRGYTEVRLLALPRAKNNEAMRQTRGRAREPSPASVTQELMNRLRMGSPNP